MNTVTTDSGRRPIVDSRNRRPRLLFGVWLSLVALGFSPAGAVAAELSAAPAIAVPRGVPAEVEGRVGPKTPQDHSQFPDLQGPFTDATQVTHACLKCHTHAARQVKSTIHWTWKAWDPTRQRMVGKNEIYNTFCVSPISNEQFCTVCHVGYGSTDPTKFIPFEQRTDDQVDCLVCHDQTRTYRKIPFIGGNPATKVIAVRPGCNEVYGTDKPFVEPLDLPNVAKHVSAPTRYTCGICHFYGGGGDGVKHGDLDSSLISPSHSLDVHMDSAGLNFACQKCHQTSDHHISGKHYMTDAKPSPAADVRGSPRNGNAVACQACHSQQPHSGKTLTSALVASTLNMHTEKVACESCHIPEFARGGKPTKVDWNYATAGKLSPNGSPLVVIDEQGRNTYWGVKGSFEWAEKVVPEYRWFDGEERWMHIGDKAVPDANGVVHVNEVYGSSTDGKSRIWPFKVSRNHQPYDTQTGVLAVFHSFGFDPDAFTMTYDWPRAIAAGMTAAKLPFSGHYGFVKTQMYWPIAHMVAPKTRALACGQCHATEGRLKDVDGVYMPGRARDHQPWIERLGLLAAALTLAGVLGHGLIRVALWLFRKS